MHLYNKEDLAKLKDSKPIQITAHTHECIVPVVYSGMVNRFLEKKGVHLPLTHHQLADMKREAGTPGYAKGTKDLKKKKGKAKAVNVSQKVIVNVTRPVRTSKAKGLYDQLRPSNWATIRSAPAPAYLSTAHAGTDFAKEAREAKAREEAMLEHYKKETASRAKQMDELIARMQPVLQAKQPLVTPSTQPLRRDDFDIIFSRDMERAKDASFNMRQPSPPILQPSPPKLPSDMSGIRKALGSPPRSPGSSAQPAGKKDMSNPPLPPPRYPLDPGSEYVMREGVRYRKVYIGRTRDNIGERYRLEPAPL